MRLAVTSLLIVCLGGLPSIVLAGPTKDALQDYFDSVTSLRGTFVQTTRDETGAVVKRSEGRFSLKRPDRFYWLYETPFEQRLISDGDWLYSYDVELAQVTVRQLQEVLGVGPAVVLSGDYENLERSFRVTAGKQGWYQLDPRDEDWEFQRVRLKLKDGIPAIVRVRDGLGQTLHLELKGLERNPGIPDERFAFDMPEGADVIAPDEFDASRR